MSSSQQLDDLGGRSWIRFFEFIDSNQFRESVNHFHDPNVCFGVESVGEVQLRGLGSRAWFTARYFEYRHFLVQRPDFDALPRLGMVEENLFLPILQKTKAQLFGGVAHSELDPCRSGVALFGLPYLGEIREFIVCRRIEPTFSLFLEIRRP